MAVIKNKRILKCLLMIVVSLFLILNFSIGVSASTNYDRQEADACITIGQRVSVKGGSKTNGIIDGKTPASRLADKVQGLSNSKRPNTVAVVRTADGRYYIGYNKAGVNNAEVQSIMDSLGNTNAFNRQCAEVNAISRAINKGANLDGATISVANVRSVGNYSGLHGTSKPPCEVCQPLLDYFGIEVVN